MFRPVPMMYVRAVVLSRDEREVLRGLGNLGVMHAAAAEAGPDTAPIAPPDNAGEMSKCDALVARVDEILKVFAPYVPLGDKKAEIGHLPLSVIEKNIATVEQAIESIKKRANEAETHRNAVNTVIEQLTSFKDVNLPFTELDKFSFLHFAIGSIPSDKLSTLQEEVAKNVVLIPLPRSAARQAVVAITGRTGRFAMETALQKADFKKETVVLDEGKTLADMIDKSRNDASAAEQTLADLDLAMRGLAAGKNAEFIALRSAIIAEKSVLDAEEKFPHTSLTTLITGWVPESDVEKVKARLGEITDGRCAVETLTPEQMPGVKVPVLLRHSWFLRPFEMLVTGYGTPGYHDLEPTLFVAITYMLMFGMMFGDAGHGLVLLLCGLGAIFASRTAKTRDVGTLVSLAGASSILFGLVYGSFFGLESFQKYALWPGHKSLDQLVQTNPMAIIKLAIATGVLVISIGVVLNVVNRIRKRDWTGGLFGGFGVVGALFYWGALGMLLKFAAIKQHGIAVPIAIAVIAIPLVIWVLYLPISQTLRKRREAKRKMAAEGSGGDEDEENNMAMSIVESAIETFETVLSYMSNTISFIRIAAYAMSHAAILMATFILADKVVGANVGGGVPRLLVIIAGNAIAIVLEGIIAAVQAMRLEYYEFFSKFFPGGGEEFKPFKLD